MNTSLVEFSPKMLTDSGLTKDDRIIHCNDSRGRYLGVLIITTVQQNEHWFWYFSIKALLITKDKSDASRILIINDNVVVAKRIKRIQ